MEIPTVIRVGGEKNNLDWLKGTLGFDPGKDKELQPGLFTDSLKEIKQERLDSCKSKIKDQLRKAIDLSEKMASIEKEFLAQKAKFDEQLGDMLAKIDRMSKGIE
jgi:ribosomal 50S subunit-associated protein YjgA (DUF615 family)